jgi:hypothetical protein
MLAASSHLLPPEPPEVGGGDVACREVFGELVDASCLSSEDYAQLLQQVVSLEVTCDYRLCRLTLTCCSWIAWRVSSRHIIRKTCTYTFQRMRLHAILFFTSLSSCTSEFVAALALCPAQATRIPQPWSFGRMYTLGPSPEQTLGVL